MVMVSKVHCVAIAVASICCGMRPWRVTKPMTKLSGKMRVVIEAARIGYLAQRNASAQRCPSMQQSRGLIETKRIDEVTARRASLREQSLEIT
jgi:hypothetical protein